MITFKNDRILPAVPCLLILAFFLNNSAFSSQLEIQHYAATNSGIGELSVIVLGKRKRFSSTHNGKCPMPKKSRK